ncbi:MAG: protein translocase subunit SecF [Candidatus Berkelbacteria bacterium]|nr:protein translocase subunit SecF [Candidatus Berkelbacteria bacterium]
MNIISYKKIWMIISLSMVVLGLIAIIFIKPKLGIDFTGGTLIEIKVEGNSNISDIRQNLTKISQGGELVIQESGISQYIIRTKTLEETQYNKFESDIKSAYPNVSILRHESIGSTVGANLTNKAITGIIIASVLIIMYLAYAFRSVPRSVSSWTFGTIAITALVHDLIFAFAIYSIVGYFAGYEIEGMTVVAALTILGFSVHDTIVVFDRIRENIIKNPQKSLAENAQASINQTFARSLNTSLTVILVLISMALLGGSTIKPFVLMLIFGIGVGTYSSIFVASPLLVYWYEYRNKKV